MPRPLLDNLHTNTRMRVMELCQKENCVEEKMHTEYKGCMSVECCQSRSKMRKGFFTKKDDVEIN